MISKIFKEWLVLFLCAHVTQFLVVINIVICIMWHFLPNLSLLEFDPDRNPWWGIITSCYLHRAIWHVTANMLGLIVYGPIVEKILGARRFFIFYTLSHLVASAPVSFGGYGASGALAGVIGASVVFTWFWQRKNEIGTTCFLLSLTGGILFLLSGNMMKAAFGIDVIDTAHFTGFLFGVLVSALLLKQDKFPLAQLYTVPD